MADSVFKVPADPALIKDALCTTGPLSVTLRGTDGAYLNYAGGILTSRDCPYNFALNHAAIIVGWTTLNGIEAWVVKNSWGEEWGLDGYAFLAADNGNFGDGPCGIYANIYGVTVASSGA